MSQQNNLSSALAKAQAEMLVAAKSGYSKHNDFYYSTLVDLIEASRPALTKYGLSITHLLDSTPTGVYLMTKLKHESGEEEVSRVLIHLENPNKIQDLGSAITYLKRYSYAAICCLSAIEPDLDDEAEGHHSSSSISSNAISSKQLGLLRAKLKGNVTREKAICDHYKIGTLDELPWRKMQEVLDILDKPEKKNE